MKSAEGGGIRKILISLGEAGRYKRIAGGGLQGEGRGRRGEKMVTR